MSTVKNPGAKFVAWAIGLLVIVQHELLLFAAAGIIIGGIDDVVMDILFLIRRGWRKVIIYSRHARMTTATLPPSPARGTIAIFVPAWHEAEVIGPMLRNALLRWGTADYRIFVGAYPNDPGTLQAIARAAAGDEHVVLGINPRPGPTTKADCLNTLWQVMLREEDRMGARFKAVVLHDAEDVVHADEIALFDLLIDRFDLVQLPVLPYLGQGSVWARCIADHYCDEFAEAHGKFLTIREALGGSIPSAGVGCAFSRNALATLADSRTDGPFDIASLTEDYETGLRIAEQGGKGVFVRIRDGRGDLVCTREHFPDSLDAAVRQKARWMVGIALAGWDRMGWRGGPVEIWMRFRDRRAALAALVLCAAYLALLLWGILCLLDLATIVPWRQMTPMLRTMLETNLALMLWRFGMRAICVGRSYGWRQGLAALPRTFVGNFITILAARRALSIYVRSLFGRPLTWDKTPHRFPNLEAGS
ncbi:glycosyl transferase family protein [Sphingobium sp. AN641]|uniref:glycosyl transferase family protein n=1 Tax=Sphingobium sp. AN641 TaxID=3133443 RepID=UPI004040AF01